VKRLVAVVICVLALPASASATPNTGVLLRSAARLSGLPAHRAVGTATLTATRYDASIVRELERQYPQTLQSVDARLYSRLGLVTRNVRAQLVDGARGSQAWYDPSARKLLVRKAASPGRARVIHELVRALVDQNFNLRRLRGLRARNRDAALAARAIIDGTAALTSGVRAARLHGTARDRFLELEYSAGLGPGRQLAAELRYLGGRDAIRSALRRFPETTEQLLHVDKFLERERALPVRLAPSVGQFRLTATETFGELDLQNLLRAVGVPDAPDVAAGWGGGRIGLYQSGPGTIVAALVLRWDTLEDAVEWRGAVPAYVAAAFPGSVARDCPPLDRCWSSTFDLTAGVLGQTSVFASGPGADSVAAALLAQG
jgi:hypothetical protein